jgi:glycosyltransferase involved in cell wall biosynthesis
VLGLPGRYTYFSTETLRSNAKKVQAGISPDTDAIVFRSAARWSLCEPALPYFIYLDAVTHTFFHNTFHERDFDRADLTRVWSDETTFLENASGVFFESDWGLRMARSAYTLNQDHYHVAGRGGALQPPAMDTWDGESLRLVTMAMDFRQKGGDIVADAYRRLRPRFPALTWSIIGGPPDFSPGTLPGVTYEGRLRIDDSAGADRLRAVLANAFLCLHPTREDTSPLVLTEAAYFGCPSISTSAFAIPELILDGETGILLERGADGAALAEAIERLLLDRERYRKMRQRAREYSLSTFRWDLTGKIICDGIDKALSR